MNAWRKGGWQRRARVLVGVCALLIIPPAILASEQDNARALSKAGTIVPLERITAQVRGRPDIEGLLEVELESDDHGYYYEVEVVDDAGLVRKLRYDAATGTLIGESVGDD